MQYGVHNSGSKKYEARALFAPAKVLGVDVGIGSDLIQHLKFPTFYDEKILRECNLSRNDINKYLGEILAKEIVPVIAKGTNTLVITYTGTNPVDAKQCLESVVSKLADQQADQLNIVLAQTKDLLRVNKQSLLQADFFEKLINNISSSRGGGLVEPIFASDRPTWPKKIPLLIAGFFCGLALGATCFVFRKHSFRAS